MAFCSSTERRPLLNEPATISAASPLTLRGGEGEEGGLLVRLKIGFYFALWYILNIVYNSKLLLFIVRYIPML